MLANGDTGDQAPLHILLVEDDPEDALLTQTLIRRAGLTAFWTVVGQLSDADVGLLDNWADCVLVDLGLPDGDGLEAVGAIRRRAPRLPVVVLSGNHDRELALRAMHAGAQDYLIKGRVDADQLAKTVRYAIERKRIEHTLRTIRTAAADHHVRLQVRDTGTGICPDILDSVFDPFFSTKPPADSAGLGLTVAQAIAARWGGYISVESAPRAGTTVTVLFPGAQAQARTRDQEAAGDQAGTGDTDAC